MKSCRERYFFASGIFSSFLLFFSPLPVALRSAAARVRVLPPALSGAPTPSSRTGRFEIEFNEPQEALTPGQAVVLYDASEPDWVLGGGWLESVGAP